MKGAVLLLLVLLVGCSLESEVTCYVSVKGFYADNNQLLVDYSLSFRPSDGAGFPRNEVHLPDNFTQAFQLTGHTVDSQFHVAPAFTEASASTVPLTLDTGFPLGEQVLSAHTELGGTYKVTLKFVPHQTSSFDVPNSVYWKLHPAVVGKYALKAVDSNDRGGWLPQSATAVSQPYTDFRDLTGEDVYIKVQVSSSPVTFQYLTSTGSLTTKTPFGGGLTFAPGMVIDLSALSF